MFAFQSRKGFALPMAILVMAILTAAVSAGFAATSSEIVANSAQRAQDRAYQLAEAGLQQFMVRRGEGGFCTGCAADPLEADSEYSRVSLTGGYADVVSYRVRPRLSDSVPAIFFVRSTGVDTTVRLSGGGYSDFAQRTVGIYATWNTATVNVLSAWTSLSGIQKKGTAGVISGVDECGEKADLPGVTIPTGGKLDIDGGWLPTGDPPVDSSNSLEELKQEVGIDWNGIINNNSLPADYTVPGTGWPAEALFADTAFWPVIRVYDDASLPYKGRGIIIVDSNFAINGSNMWDGIVLVGGALTSNGNNTTAGATLSGLNLLLAGAEDPGAGIHDDVATANGQKTYVFSSCKVSRAAQRLRVYFSLSNTWMDNVAIW